MGHVVAHRLEIRFLQQLGDVGLAPGEIIVDAEHVVALGAQAVAEMRAEEAGAAGDQYPFLHSAHRIVLRGCPANSDHGDQAMIRRPAGVSVIGSPLN